MEEFNLSKSAFENGLQKIHRLEKLPSKTLDAAFEEAHDTVFEEMDCLSCANCCKTTSPIIEQTDMDRLAAALNISRAQLLRDYLTMDEDGDFVFQQTPCPMLEPDNRCRVYENRPEACRDYPHTRRKNMLEVMDILESNLKICPAVEKIIDRITVS